MYKKTAKYLTFWTILNFCFLDFLDNFSRPVNVRLICQARSNKNLFLCSSRRDHRKFLVCGDSERLRV